MLCRPLQRRFAGYRRVRLNRKHMKKHTSPETMTGIWLDQEKAFIISFTGEELQPVERIRSAVESRVRVPGETKVFARFGQAFLDDQEKKQHRQVQQRHRFFREIMTHLSGSTFVVVFGPGQARYGLANELEKDPVLKAKLTAVEPADRITRAQMIQWVKNYFDSEAFREFRKKMKKERKLQETH